MTTTATFDLAADGIEPLALTVEMDAALRGALTGDNRVEITAAINTAINAQLAESGWDGDWSASDIVAAILDVAEVAEEIACDFLGYLNTTPDTQMEIRHSLVEGHDADYGTAQATELSISDSAQGAYAANLRYSLPADLDDERVYWRAFEAADAYLREWLTVHGIDPAATETFGTGWSVSFRRAQWK